jgi:hypothetical protein
MSGSTTTAGGFILGGFDTPYFSTGGYSSTVTTGFAIDPAQNTGSFDFNYAGSQVVSSSPSTDSWSLTVTFNSPNPNDYLFYGYNPSDGSSVESLEGGTGPASFTLTGTGDASLTSLIQGLELFPGGTETAPLAVTLDLVDTTLAPGGTPTGGNSATESTTTSYFVACYAAGTRIATPSGETDIAALSIGDLVATASGAAVPVEWIGRRAYSAAQIAANPHLRPVLIRQGALAADMPHRDLMVSPMHALFIDDVFVPAAALVNGVSILRSEALEPVSYIHIELAGHDVVFAEGAPSETFVDDNSRLMFDNADEYYDMFGAASAQAGFSAPRIEQGYQLEAIRRRIAARAGLTVPAIGSGPLAGHVERLDDGILEGWVADTGAAPVELDVLVDGEFTARILANRYRPDLDRAGIAGGRCAFSVALPASVSSLAQIAVRRSADGVLVAMPERAALSV